MFPVICKIGPLTVYSYGLMMAVSVIVCAILLSRDAGGKGISADVVYDFIFWAVLAGIAGARLFYILLNFEFFRQSPGEIVMLQNGGLAWQGGLIAGSLCTFYFVKHKRLSVPMFADLVAPYVALGQAIGRIGCFLNGCCYGRPVPWGIYFPVHHEHLHPTQLYSAFNLTVIFFILKAFQKHARAPGQVLVLYFILASAERFIVEFFRADHKMSWGGLSEFQVVSLVIFLAALLVNFRLTMKRKSG